MKRLRILTFILASVVGMALCVAGYVFGQHVPMEEQWPLFEALRTTAAIIFAVVGAWLAIIYPERLKIAVRGADNGFDSSPRLRLVLTPVVSSALILIIVLLLGILLPLVRQLTILGPFADALRGVSFAFLVVLTLWQMVTVIIAILPVDVLIARDAEERAIKEVVDHYGSQRQTRARGRVVDDEDGAV